MRKLRWENHDIHEPWGEKNRWPDNEQRETDDLNTQKGNKVSGNTWQNTADTKEHDAAGEAKLNTPNMETKLSK